METKEVTIDSPVRVAGVTLVPVVKVLRSQRQGNHGTWLFGSKQPVGIVVVAPSSRRAFRINGEEVSLGRFMEEVPGINDILEGI